MNTTELNENPVAEMKTEANEFRESVRNLAKATDQCIHQYAWASVGLAAALGICVGLLIGNSDRGESE